MKLSSSFSVPADSIRVFERFLDAPTMRSCIPGCEELVRVDDEHYTGRLVNEIAHVRFNASFSAEIVGLDPPYEVRAVLKGEDRRLASSLKLDAVLQVRPDGAASLVTYTMEMAMWGKLGRMGESIFRRRTAEVERQFVEAFTLACRGGVAAEPSSPALVATAPDSAGDAAVVPAVAVRTRPVTADSHRAQHQGVPWWQRVLAWFGGRGSRGARR